MFEYDPKTTLQQFPSIPMARFGVTPYGELAYRVVFGPSRRYLVFGEWPDGSRCAHWKIKYPVGNHWILEGWQSAAQFHPLGRHHWDANLLSILGPWPERGEYELIHVFYEAPPTSGQVEKLITWSKYGRETVSFAESLTNQREEAMREAAHRTAMADDLIRDKMPAFGIRAFAGTHGRRRSRDEDPELRSAEELGLPTTPGMRVVAAA